MAFYVIGKAVSTSRRALILYLAFGSRISLRPLPRKLKARMVRKIARAGERIWRLGFRS